MKWEQLLNNQRFMRTETLGDAGEGRTEFEGDYDRILFSHSFRRLHDKTQVFPMPKNDHVHTRLTHSLEVASVGRSLGRACGDMLKDCTGLGDYSGAAFGSIVAAACLAHDIGNPPFGHAGEDAIKMWFKEDPLKLEVRNKRKFGDFLNFEGNAQGFRIVAQLENHPNQGGLQLTFATLGAFLKYPQDSRNVGKGEARKEASRKKHGANVLESESLGIVCETLGLGRHADAEFAWKRHPLAFLTEAADDICNGILDIEDGVRLKHVPVELASSLLQQVIHGPEFKPSSHELPIEKLRAQAINALIKEVKTVFLKNEVALLSGDFEQPLVKEIKAGVVLKSIGGVNKKYCYDHSTVLEKEIAGFEVIYKLLSLFVAARLSLKINEKLEEKVDKLLPASSAATVEGKIAEVVDFVSGMTDHYAVELYRTVVGLSLPA